MYAHVLYLIQVYDSITSGMINHLQLAYFLILKEQYKNLILI